VPSEAPLEVPQPKAHGSRQKAKSCKLASSDYLILESHQFFLYPEITVLLYVSFTLFLCHFSHRIIVFDFSTFLLLVLYQCHNFIINTYNFPIHFTFCLVWSISPFLSLTSSSGSFHNARSRRQGKCSHIQHFCILLKYILLGV
jgi:hypothetical protein